MSVEAVMNTMATQDASDSLGASAVPSGSSNSGKPVVSGVDDIFNLYSAEGDQGEADKNGIELKEDDKKIPDELNNPEPKKETKKEEEEPKEEKKEEEKPQIETKKEEKTPSQDKVKVRVNGQEVEVPLQDVINSYSGQQSSVHFY